ncbi:phage holin family protein [Bacillus sp. BHET2]|uniref:phage holin family protein n=1 Tax=Bacillus sp. BHET2 TaxID=2583818 RepID=UPI00110E13AA|nr:phage holin family protein [Bacillus sp. BHET2]TMU86005.1 phage holin family protein [Bacillus sp. BHET2]
MEKSILFLGAGVGAIILNLFGEWDMLITFLLIAVILDYFTGLIASGIEGKLSSKFGVKGIGRKVLIFSLVTVAHLIDTILTNQHFIRNATIIFYLCNEMISIIENVGRAGVPVPGFLKKAVEVLRKNRSE